MFYDGRLAMPTIDMRMQGTPLFCSAPGVGGLLTNSVQKKELEYDKESGNGFDDSRCIVVKA